MKTLVVGAGLAGGAAALLLSSRGHDVTVVDAVEKPYSGGYQILLDDTAMAVMDQLGTSDLAHEHSGVAPAISVRWNGRKVTTIDTPGYRLARRGDLVGAFAQRVDQEVPIQFGRGLVGIQQHVDGVVAHFDDGSQTAFDLIIGADGLSSTVRRLALEHDRSYQYTNGRVVLWVNVPGRLDAGKTGALLLGSKAQAQVFPYPDADETLVVTAMRAPSPRPSAAELVPTAAALLDRSGEDLAVIAQRVREANIETDTRVTAFAQVRAPRWYARNVILLGDAAHCIDPLSGVGAHGGLLGASLLDDELARTPYDIAGAARRYERRAKGFVRPAQFLTAALTEATTASSLLHHAKAAGSVLAAVATARKTSVPAAA